MSNKVRQKLKINLGKQISKVLLSIKGRTETLKDASDSEDIKEDDQEMYTASYWKLQYLNDLNQVTNEGALLSRMHTNPQLFQTVFNPSQLSRSLENMQKETEDYKPLDYYTDQLSYIHNRGRVKEGSSDMGGLFARLEEKPASSNVVLLEELLSTSVGLKKKPAKRIQMVIEEEAEVTMGNLKRVVGILPEDIGKIKKYQIRPWKLPTFSNKFDKVDKLSAMMSARNIDRYNEAFKTYSYFNERNLTIFDKAGKGKKGISALTPEEQEAAIKEREEKRQRYNQMPQEERELAEKAAVSKQWTWIAKKDIPKAHKIYVKCKLEIEANAKRVAMLCAKEIKKKGIKSHKLEKEALLRAKRVHRDVLTYWRKREKEIVEMKRKRERIEREIKKKEEEQREALLMKKRLEFLITQSNIYANFMARKLGVVQEESPNQFIPKPEPDPEVDIDENLAKKRVQAMMNSHIESVRIFDQETQALRMERGGPAGVISQVKEVQDEDLENSQAANGFANPDMPMSQVISLPKIFLGDLKEYQFKGLKWLDNLNEQAINGILADEMGLGKTIQAISFLAHLAENKGNWGPFLIVAPSSTLYNWQQEFEKFCPSLRVLPYWGALAERKTLRKFFNSKQLYTPSSPFHVLVTSYQLVVADEKSFHRVIWQYMILDEAQAIKNINSQRWRTLLGFNCRNRLLMTGTPIQNSMAELWALLHFIMPKLFDNHEQFQEWFSKDIEANSQNAKELNTRQLSRLHAILKPFMLRRVKKDVEHEIGPKEELELFCDMTSRQKLLYQTIRDHLSNITDLFSLVDSKQKMENLMNLVMQLRKVCNHPELFERRVGKSPVLFREITPPKPLYIGFNKTPWITYTETNPICYELPKLVFNELFNVSQRCKGLHNETLEANGRSIIDFYSPSHIYELAMNKSSCFRFLGFSFSELALLLSSNEILAYICLLHYQSRMKVLSEYMNSSKLLSGECAVSMPLLIIRKCLPSIVYKHIENLDRPLVYESALDLKNDIRHHINRVKFYVLNASTVPIRMHCSSNRFYRYCVNSTENELLQYILLGNTSILSYNHFRGKSKLSETTLLPNYNPNAKYYEKSLNGYQLFEEGLLPELFYNSEGTAEIEVPQFNKLISDCAKLRVLDDLLKRLKEEGHRCLIFCQMTKMLDILEDYLSWRKYKYFRMDGSSSIADRRDMVQEFQKNPQVFCFLLSTRACGLGVTLTAADTVIFYDNDWNPTMDAQATDRAHRIGQTKKVSIYRLITKGTVEERIVKRAKQKQNVQATVYSGGAFKGDVFKPKEVIELLYDEDERKKHQQTVPQLNKKGKKKAEVVEEEKKPVEKKKCFAVEKQVTNGHKDKDSESGDDSDLKFEVNAELYDT
jgi:DNA helicase INO80